MPSATLLPDLQHLVSRLENDLRDRAPGTPEIQDHVGREYAQAKQAGRTGEAREQFQEQLFTQGAVAWVLSAVFVRFLEDNGFLDERDGTAGRWLSGHTGRHIAVAKDTERHYFQEHSHHGERDYLLHVFRSLRALPGLERLFDPKHNALWHLPISADAARDLLALLRRVDPETGEPVHAFHDPGLDTRFLGDLYQDLSESARKRYALLQTPEFVEEFILDYTLEPAIEEFGYSEVNLIDPACGSGHFLLGAFQRLLTLHRRHEPEGNERELAQRALDQVAGVDLNPFAVAIARFRLLVVALRAGGVTRLEDAPDYRVHVAAGDSLLHGRRPGELFDKRELMAGDQRTWEHYYATEDPEEASQILSRHYHAVVGNPPYISVKDPGLRELYRSFYGSCHGKYTYVPPFLERFFDLAIQPPIGKSQPAGFVGAIVGNAFMQRQFGKKLIEEFFPKWDLTHILDTSGAYIPGHGTPTVILFGRHRMPVSPAIRAVLGIRGEPGAPEDAAEGKVWSAIVQQIFKPGSESDFVSVDDVPRKRYESHPWSLQGGGATELKITLEGAAKRTLGQQAEHVGITAVTGEDDLYVFPSRVNLARKRVELRMPLVTGEVVRDWVMTDLQMAVWLYDKSFDLVSLASVPEAHKLLWTARKLLSKRRRFGTPMLEKGLSWYEWQELYRSKFVTPLSITFAEVATHNHFVLDRGGKVFKQTAPVIKLPEGSSENEHLGLLGFLNSSTCEFWVKQVCFDKGGGGIGGGLATEEWERFYQRSSTVLSQLPIPSTFPTKRSQQLDSLARDLLASSPRTSLESDVVAIPSLLQAARVDNELILSQMIAVQEELDWEVYQIFGLLEEDLTPHPDPPPLALGERASEIVTARRSAAGDLETTWFERHGSKPTTEIPSHWPEDYQRLVQRRIKIIESNTNIRLIEKPEYKRRWNTEPWEVQEKRALRRWLLDRLEADGLWDQARLTSTARLADRMRRDPGFMQVAALYRGHEDFDATKLVTELAQEEGVPYLSTDCYKPSGLRKRKIWERVWDLQREQDALDARTELPEDHPEHLSEKEATRRKAALDISVPPKYRSADFVSSTIWRHRGKLDVPKEQFILYPKAEREADPTPVLGWAGWNQLQQAEALATYYTQMRDTEGWPKERLLPLLAGLLELLPWLRQWHNEHDAELGMGMGDYYAGFLDEEARRHGVTPSELKGLKR